MRSVVAGLVVGLFLSACGVLAPRSAPRLENDIRRFSLWEAWVDIAAYGEFAAEGARINMFQITWNDRGNLEHYYVPFVVQTSKGEWTAAIADYLPAAEGGSSLRAYPLRGEPSAQAYVSARSLFQAVDTYGLGSLAEALSGRGRFTVMFQVLPGDLILDAADQGPLYVLQGGRKIALHEPYRVQGRMALLMLMPLQGVESHRGIIYLLPEVE